MKLAPEKLVHTTERYSIHLTKEVAKKIMEDITLTADERLNNGVFFGSTPTDKRFNISYHYMDGKGHISLTATSTMNMITEEVFECLVKANEYFKKIEAEKPMIYGQFIVDWSEGGKVYLKNDKKYVVGKVYIISGVRINFDQNYVDIFSFNESDIKAIDDIMQDAKTKL